MTPELLSETTINLLLLGLTVIGGLCATVGTVNLVESTTRIRRASEYEALGQRQRIIALDIFWAGVGTIVVGLAAMLWTIQGLVGEFNLTTGWFTYTFLGGLYAGPTTMMLLRIREFVSRRRLDRVQ